MKTTAVCFMVVGLGLAGCAPPTVPQRPSWDVDVFPILQGNCNHCHGETVGRLVNQPLGRLDVCDPAPFVAEGITPVGLVCARVEGGLFAANLRPAMGVARPAMPPPACHESRRFVRALFVARCVWVKVRSRP